MKEINQYTELDVTYEVEKEVVQSLALN
ncbi:hypothetical protein [Planococcus faecalis]